jgi:hypothetical protein
VKKIILWSIVSLVIVGIAVDAFLWLHKPQVIQLDKNTKLTLLGVDYGKHHRPPALKLKGGRRAGQSFDTTNETLVIWILDETKGNQRYGWQALVSDRAQTGAVMSWANRWDQAGANRQIAAVQLDAFPRRDSKFFMRFMSWGGNGQHVSKDQFVISNPARDKSFSQWTPEPIPDTQSDGDLSVTLTKCVFGAEGFGGRELPPKDPANKAVATAFHCEQNGHTVTNWQPVRIETSDATGNHVQNNSWSNGRDDNGDATMTYQWGLWPGQTPWKLDVEMSRTSGFNDDEIWAIANLPVNPGKQMDFWNYGNNNRAGAPFAETTLNGVHLKIYPAVQFTDQNFNGQKMGGFRVIADPPPPDGFRMSLASATDENGRVIQSWNPSWGGGNYGFQIQNLRNAKFLNLTIALHKSRFVEFTVNPARQ